MTHRPLTLINHARGGLGNQLFQYAFARSLARLMEADLLTDTSSFAADPYSRKFRLSEIVPSLSTGEITGYVGAGAYILKEDQLASLSEPINMPSDARTLVLHGYWQSEKYINPHEIENLYCQLDAYSQPRIPDALLRKITSSAHPVAVHIRRRDYSHMGICKESYYCAAISLIQEKYSNIDLFIFTDEPNQVRHWMRMKRIEGTQVATGDDLLDLYLMSACRHFVIANSSFSWWAARWGERHGGLVFCPSEWVTLGQVKSPCPPRWIHVPNSVQPFNIDEQDVAEKTEKLRAQVTKNTLQEVQSKAIPGITDTGRIDLRHFLEGMSDYVVIRIAENFPHYRDHEDIDVLCRDVEKVRAHIFRVGKAALENGYRILESCDNGHLHVDFYLPDSTRLSVRFDLIGDLTGYRKFIVDRKYHEVVLDSRQQLIIGGCPVFVPAKAHELALRCLEYLEWKDINPNKKKHLDYLNKHSGVDFISLVQRYTNLALPTSMKLIPEQYNSPAPTRFDFLILWGHALPFTEEIIQMVRQHPDLEIVTILHQDISDIAKFVHDIYACDTVPFSHLEAKTRYLMKTPATVLFLLLRNYRPDEQQFGSGEFQHIQSRTIKDLKETIRNRFNPRKSDGTRSEDHVVHASDYPSQVSHVLRVLNLPPLTHFSSEAHPDIDAPYHLGVLDRLEIADLPLDAMVANVLDLGLVPIKMTPHYAYVTGHQENYRNYHARYFGTKLTDDHLPDAFDEMLQNFRYGERLRNGKRSLIVAQPIGNGIYRILDGLHRAAILTSRGVNMVEVAVTSRN